MLTALLMIICFYKANSVYYQSAAFEAALAGNQYVAGSGSAGVAILPSSSDPAGAGEAESSAQARISGQTMPGTQPAHSVSCTGSGTEVSFTGQDYAMFTGLFELNIKENVKKVRPVPVVRALFTVKSYADRL